MRDGTRLGLVLGSLLLLAVPARAADVPWDRVLNARPGSLSRADRERAGRLLREIVNYHGCSDTLAACLVKAPGCETARRVAGLVVRMVAAGRTDAEVREAVKDRARAVHPFKVHRFNLTARPRLGAAESAAKVTVVEFADFECPFCRVISPILARLVKELAPQGVSLVFKNYPVSSHPRALPAARGGWAAHQLGRFWELHDQLYRQAPRLSDADLERAARSVGLVLAAWNAARQQARAEQVIAADKAEGLRAGVQGTPTIYVNGKQYHGRKDYTELRDRLEEELMLLRGGK